MDTVFVHTDEHEHSGRFAEAEGKYEQAKEMRQQIHGLSKTVLGKTILRIIAIP